MPIRTHPQALDLMEPCRKAASSREEQEEEDQQQQQEGEEGEGEEMASTRMRRRAQSRLPHHWSCGRTTMASNGSLSSIQEIESRWSIQFDVMLNL